MNTPLLILIPLPQQQYHRLLRFPPLPPWKPLRHPMNSLRLIPLPQQHHHHHHRLHHLRSPTLRKRLQHSMSAPQLIPLPQHHHRRRLHHLRSPTPRKPPHRQHHARHRLIHLRQILSRSPSVYRLVWAFHSSSFRRSRSSTMSHAVRDLASPRTPAFILEYSNKISPCKLQITTCCAANKSPTRLSTHLYLIAFAFEPTCDLVLAREPSKQARNSVSTYAHIFVVFLDFAFYIYTQQRDVNSVRKRESEKQNTAMKMKL